MSVPTTSRTVSEATDAMSIAIATASTTRGSVSRATQDDSAAVARGGGGGVGWTLGPRAWAASVWRGPFVPE